MSFEEYEHYDALGLAELVHRGDVSPEDLLEAALERCANRNPQLNAVVIEMESYARRAIEQGLPNGPFHGVPFLVKDLALQIKGERTTNGCRLFADHVADHDREFAAYYDFLTSLLVPDAPAH